ncbi:pre-mRNA-processing protein 40C [Typha latifolia]|uniref:pre-mRNA-processing protein 40C n=1 Tax=Typha latifolia TaxID=4733 RepID=UPI003C2C134E
MSTPVWIAQEVQHSAPSETQKSQNAEAPIGGQNSALPDSIRAPSNLVSPVQGPTSSAAPTTSSSPPEGSGPSSTVTVPAAPSANPPSPRNTLINANSPKFAASPGYAVPAPPFSYSVFPRANSALGNTQSISAPVFRLAPPVPAAALQPPVPGQYMGNRPSFSYNVVSHANAVSPTVQLNTAANQSHFHGGKVVPPNTAALLQPPVPGQLARPNAIFSGSVAPNLRAPAQLPLPFPRNLSNPANFSFSGNLQQAPAETSEGKMPSNTANPDVVASDTTSGVSVSSQNVQLPSGQPSSSVASCTNDNENSSGLIMPTTPSFAPRPGTSPGLPTTISQSTTVIPSLKNIVASPGSLSQTSNAAPTPGPVLQTVQQQLYPTYPSVSTIVPPPQALWLNPSQGNLQHTPFLPYPGGLPAALPVTMHGISPAIPSTSIQPPGVSTIVGPEESASTISGSHHLSNTSALESPSTDHHKQANDLQKEEATTKYEDADVWTAHKTDSGAIYYYNSVTGKSTYEKPADFKGEIERITAQSVPVSWEKLAGTDWTLVTTNDGKKYYYDTKTKVSSWQLPPDIAELRKNQEGDSLKGNAIQLQNAVILTEKVSAAVSISAPAAQTGGRDSVALRAPAALVSSSALDLIKKKLQDAGTPSSPSPLPASGSGTSDSNGLKAVEPTTKEPQVSNSKDKSKDANGDGNMTDSSSDSDDEESGPTQEECIIQFKEMLKERGVAPFSKWDKELPKIVFDPRFKAVPSYSSRRAIFEHYVRTRAEQERKEKRAAQKAAVDAFKQVLEEAAEDIDHKSDYQAFKRKWGSDPRFEGLDRKERELLFNEKVKAAKEKVQSMRMATIASFKSLLRDSKGITLSSRWSKVKDSFRSDPRYKAVKHEEREVLFNEYISELKSVEEEVERSAKAKVDEQEKLRERERETRKRKEREEQEMERVRIKVRRKEAVSSYQALLVETIKDPKASWTESKPKLEKDPQGRAANPDLSQGDAEKLFRDHVKDLYERCAREYRTLLTEVITVEAAAHATDDGKTVLSSWTEAKRLLKPDPRYSKMPSKDRESIWRRYAEDMIQKQKKPSDLKEKPDTDGRSRTSSSLSSRSHGRR